MENIKERFSDVAHNWTAIAMITLFLFTNNSVVSVIPKAEALVVKPEQTQMQEAKLKKETLEKFSNTVYKPSELLTDEELVKLLKAVGFEGSALKMAWAIAKAESNGRPMAYNGNRNTGDSSYGIFQINMLGNLGIDRKEKFDLRSNVLLFDPVINAEITYYMTKGGDDWSSWPNSIGKAKKLVMQFPKV
ncbi:MAG: hypothetical protein RLZZ196_873 [Bacteroidota bacterium]